MEGYNGNISVASEPEKGTVFTVYLPISEEGPSSHQSTSKELPTGDERILFVDDEPPIVKMASRFLEGLGYDVTGLCTAAEALDLFKSDPERFDLVITDMTMPNITGDRVAAEMMTVRKDVPIILCTGYSKKISAERVSEIGIKALIYKPLVRADLSKAIRNVLDEGKGITRNG